MTKEKIECPEWFNPINYDKAGEFTKEQWFEQITLRFLLYSMPLHDSNFNEITNHFFDKIINEKYPFFDCPEVVICFVDLLQKPSLNNASISIGDLLINPGHRPLVFNNLWSTTTSETVKNFLAISKNETGFNNLINTAKWQNKNNKFVSSPVNINPEV